MPYEVKISSKFGYHHYDSLGNNYMELQDTSMEQKHSLVPYLKIFPKKAILKPLSEQKVQCLVKHPRDISDGTYWSRLSVESRPIVNELDTGAAGVPAMMFLITETTSLCAYPKGDLTLGLEVSGFFVKKDSDNLLIYVDYLKTGNMPFWGNLRIDFYDEDGSLVDTLVEKNVVYKSARVSYSMKGDKFIPGKYTAKIFIDNKRSTKLIPGKFLLDFEDVEEEFGFVLP